MDCGNVTNVAGDEDQRKQRLSLPVVRTEFGFERTSCDCERCSFWCRVVPGFLIPSDLQRLCPPGVDLMAWAKEHLRASQETFARNPKTGKTMRIRYLVPAKQANGHCQWLQPDGHCAVHDNSPFGCAFFDGHMTYREGINRALPARIACEEDFAASGTYSQVWYMLTKEGLWITREELQAGKAESLKIGAKLAKRAAWQARKQRRKKRKQVRRRS